MQNWKRKYILIWSGQFVSILTSATVNFAVILWITLQTGSAQMLAWAAVAGLLPQTLLGPLIGVFIDRWKRKRIMIFADSFIALCTLILACLFWIDIVQTGSIFLILALRSLGSAFHAPAMQASIPMIVPKEQLTRVSGFNQMIFSGANIAAPALAALLIVNIKIEYILLLDVLGAVFACLTLLPVEIPNPESVSKNISGVFTEIKQGIDSVLENRGLSLIFLFVVLLTFFYMPISVLLPLMTSEYFGGDEFRISIIEIVWSGGALVGSALIGAKIYKINKVVLLNISYILCGISVFVTGLLPTDGFRFFVLLMAIGGLAGGIYNSLFTAIVQLNVNPATLGRVFSMFYSLHLLPALIGLISIGFFTDVIGVKNSFIICGILLLFVGIFAFITPSAFKLGKK